MISICIPCYRGADRLDRLLVRLLSSTKAPFIHEIIIVDDGSPHEDAKKIHEVANNINALGFAPVRLVVLPKNLGPVGALQIATEKATGTSILQLDDDLVLPDGFFTVATNLLSLPNIGVLSWRSYGTNPGQSTQPAVGFMEPATEIAGYCMAYNRTVFEKVGGIDTRFKFYCSDSDFALRVALAGHPCYRVWWPLVPHAEHASIDDGSRRQLAEQDLAAFRQKWGATGPEMEKRAIARFRGEST